MKFITTPIAGLLVIEHQVWEDSRGYFIETYNQQPFRINGVDETFVEDNLSCSRKNVLRGLHAQSGPNAQGKLVRVLRGSVLDVAVDIRKGSATYGQHFTVELSAGNARSFWIPAGFLHGFLALEEDTLFAYKVTGFYDKDGEIGVRWDDPELNIKWPVNDSQLIVSDKDRNLPLLSEIDNPF